jgi:hypothetical protein
MSDSHLSDPGSQGLGKSQRSAEDAGEWSHSLPERATAYREVADRRPGTLQTRRGIPPKLYRIGEVVEYSGVSRQTIHNYTTMGLLQETRWTAGGHRLYDESVFGRLDTIAELKGQRMSLQDIREHFAQLDTR